MNNLQEDNNAAGAQLFVFYFIALIWTFIGNGIVVVNMMPPMLPGI